MLAHDIRADDDRAGRRLDNAGQGAGQNRLPRPRQATDCDQHWRLRHNEALRQIEIAFGFMPDRFPAGHLFALGEKHMRADRRPHREK
jgi:hypothetical protein